MCNCWFAVRGVFMRSLLRSMRSALAASVWRRFEPRAVEVKVGHVIILAVALIGTTVFFQWVESLPRPTFRLYGINSAIATNAVSVGVVVILAGRGFRLGKAATLLALFLVADVVLFATSWALDFIPGNSRGGIGLSLPATIAVVVSIIFLFVVWLGGAVRKVILSYEGRKSRMPLLRATGLAIGFLAASFALPNWPTFSGESFSRTTANVWELGSAYRAATNSRPDQIEMAREDAWAAIELSQDDLLDHAIAKLAPRQEGARNVYALGVAGWSAQKVFVREIDGALEVFRARFGQDRSLQLLNHGSTAKKVPIANIRNLAVAVNGIAEKMDRENDVFLLIMTSHGSASGFALSYGSAVSRVLTPRTLKRMLDEAGIKNRVVIVSACYSGVFVPVLADDNSIVMTASSSDRNSFGCSNDRDWTYFGDALFNHGIREKGDLVAAFERARALIGEWEARDGLEPSQPQIHVGPAFKARFPELAGEAPVQKAQGERSLAR
jgi:hypothetical protein